MPLQEVGWLLTPLRLQLCPRLKQRAGRGYLLGLRSPQLESPRPPLGLRNGAGPSPGGVLASADLWTAVQETDWSQEAPGEITSPFSAPASSSVEWGQRGDPLPGVRGE